MKKILKLKNKKKLSLFPIILSLLVSTLSCTTNEANRQSKPANFNFYKDYLAKYFPKAFVIRKQIFIQMNPEEISKALQNIIDVFTDQPWFYFVNKPKGFKLTHYWEHIVDQLSLISEFLENASVEIDTKTIIFLRKSNSFDFDSMFSEKTKEKIQSKQSLLDHLYNLPQTSVFDFYALCFDYLVKLFNEGILSEDIGKVMYYFYELEYVTELLQGSNHEVEYQEHLSTCKELSSLLERSLGFGSF